MVFSSFALWPVCPAICVIDDVIIFPDRVEGKWWRKHDHQLQEVDLKTMFEGKPEIPVIGTGYCGLMKGSAGLTDSLKSRGIKLVAQKTQDACTTYNHLVGSKKKVIAALHLTC